MKIFSTIADLQNYLHKNCQGLSLGFVPTMGALHQGHLTLVEKAIKESDICLCSIFVNPTQFNSSVDLENYPMRTEQDLKLLKDYGCGLVFMPDKEEIYPADFSAKDYDFGLLDKVMEGLNRSGHFQGVASVVSRLFDIVKPNKAFFGEKDFQQLAIIRALTKIENRAIEIVPCPIIREEDGLAMSSRNLLLSPEHRQIAPKIYHLLSQAKSLKDRLSVLELKQWLAKEFQKEALLELEYFEISDYQSLRPSAQWSDFQRHVICVAVFAGPVRLIDNIVLDFNLFN
jgi:pantoate--beta-alanine ligase